MGIAHAVDCACPRCIPPAARQYPPDDFVTRATELARAAGWTAPNGIFIAGDLQQLWRAAVTANPSHPITALESFPCFCSHDWTATTYGRRCTRCGYAEQHHGGSGCGVGYGFSDHD